MEKKYKPTTLRELKRLCDNLTINLGDIDTSLITDMSKLFYESSRKGDDFRGIETWNVSGVRSMGYMFFGAKFFNQPLNSWDVSKVKDMAHIFFGAESFNQPLDSWNVSGVEDMCAMFLGAKSFNQPLDSWDVSGVRYMNYMFAKTESFNQPLDSWNVSGVKSVNGMFCRAKSFNQPLDSWNVSGVEGMYEMFCEAESFNQPLDSWNVANVKDMGYMFYGAKSFNQPLDSWNVSGVEDMKKMFYKAESFNQPIDKWKVENLSSANNFFGSNILSFEQGLKKALGENTLYEIGFDTIKGEYVLIRDEEQYHINPLGMLKGEFDVAIQTAKEALETRRVEKERQKKLTEEIKANANKVVVLAEDSYKAGNCVSGTRDFCKKHKISLEKGVRGDILLRKAKGDEQEKLAINAILQSFKRNGVILSS